MIGFLFLLGTIVTFVGFEATNALTVHVGCYLMLSNGAIYVWQTKDEIIKAIKEK